MDKYTYQLENKVVLITGGSSGIGQAIAIRFAQEGAKVVFSYNTNKSGASKTERSIKKLGSKCLSLQADLTSEIDRKNLFKKTREHFSKLDILVNNAGISSIGEDQLDLDVWHKIFEVNLFSVVACTKSAIKLMPSQGGKIINVSSIYGNERFGSPDELPYCAAKSALNSFTRTLAKQIAPKILVNAVAPGYVDTPIWGEITEEYKRKTSKDQLIERFIRPEEIADAIVFVAKNNAVSGEVVVIDGGLSLRTLAFATQNEP